MDDNKVQDNSTAQDDSGVPTNWLELVDGKFTCSECENESVPETNTIDGKLPADTEQIKADMQEFPTKVIYGVCPVCGMEYTFKEKNDKLYLEPSDMLK